MVDAGYMGAGFLNLELVLFAGYAVWWILMLPCEFVL